MNGRFFLDTNIFVYSFDASSPKKAAQARKLIRSAIETRGGIVSYQECKSSLALHCAISQSPCAASTQNNIVDHVSSTPFSAFFASFVWRGTPDWSQVPIALVRFVDRCLCNRTTLLRCKFHSSPANTLETKSANTRKMPKVSVEFFKAKTFRMDGRLEASRSPTPLSDRRTSSWESQIAGGENNGSEGASPSRSNHSKLVAGACNHPNESSVKFALIQPKVWKALPVCPSLRPLWHLFGLKGFTGRIAGRPLKQSTLSIWMVAGAGVISGYESRW